MRRSWFSGEGHLEQMKRDSRLDALRSRDDYKKPLADLKAETPTRRK